jgi:periplasmic protein TonB
MHVLIAALIFSLLLHFLAALSRWRFEPAAAIPSAALFEIFGLAPNRSVQSANTPTLHVLLASPDAARSANPKSIAVISAFSAASKVPAVQAHAVQVVRITKPTLADNARLASTPTAPKLVLESTPPIVKAPAGAPAALSINPPTAVSDAIDTGDPATVALEISAWLRGFLRYPRAAQRAGIEGRVLLRFKLHPDGSVSALTIAASSGAAILDNAALRLVNQAQPLPTPSGWQSDAIEIEVPVDFELQRLSNAGAQRLWR